jgi:hypothetical protein
MIEEDIIFDAGGIDQDGRLQDPRRLWSLLADAPTLAVRREYGYPAAEVRLFPNDAGAVYYDVIEDSYWLLSPEEALELLAPTIER